MGLLGIENETWFWILLCSYTAFLFIRLVVTALWHFFSSRNKNKKKEA